MKILIPVLVSLFSTLIVAAVPTAEGLFRNGNNKDIDGDMIVLTFIIEEHVNKKLIESSKVAETTEQVEDKLLGEKMGPRYFKIIYGTESEERVEAILVEYNRAKLSAKSVIDVKYFSNLIEKIKSDEFIEREIFYSVLNMLALNDSRAIAQVLMRHNTNFNDNNKLLNEKKYKLLNDYKKYLQTVKEDESLKETLENPLKPEDNEKMETVKETMGMPLYQRDETVKLVRDNTDFYWQVGLENSFAKFDSKKQRLIEFVHNNGSSSIKINMGEYILFDGIHELPKYIFLKDLLERVFKVQVTSYKVFKNTGKKMIQRYKQYGELVKKNKKNIQKVESVDEEKMVRLFVY
jgi:hypothetical protein